MIYVYFDEKGVLKELINDVVNSGDSNVNKIAAFWENDSNTYDCGIRFQLADKTFYPATATLLESTTEYLTIPFNKKQDLKFFEYNKIYAFRTFVIPDNVLANDTDGNLPVVSTVYYSTANTVKAMDRFAFGVGPSTLSVAMDEHINLAEWNSLVKILANKQLFIVDDISDVVVDNYRPYDMFFAISENEFYYINDQNVLISWHLGLTFDSVPTLNSSNPVTSNGIYTWVLNQMANLGFKTLICSTPEDTPDVVGGELAPEDADRKCIYLVADGNEYKEYLAVFDPISTYTKWEMIGSTGIGLPDTPTDDGTYILKADVSGGVSTYTWKKENIEEFTILSQSWVENNDILPFEYQVTVTATGTIPQNGVIELIADNAILFSTYGFCIASVANQNITIYSLSRPSETVTLKIKF